MFNHIAKYCMNHVVQQRILQFGIARYVGWDSRSDFVYYHAQIRGDGGEQRRSLLYSGYSRVRSFDKTTLPYICEALASPRRCIASFCSSLLTGLFPKHRLTHPCRMTSVTSLPFPRRGHATAPWSNYVCVCVCVCVCLCVCVCVCVCLCVPHTMPYTHTHTHTHTQMH